ncbi:MAG: hypothetical protein ABSB67_22195, partial [Bryobacteraceae bacterium]
MQGLLCYLTAVAAMVIAASAPGADKPPNLSGKWTLDKTRSEFARGAPDSLAAAITDDGEKIRMVQTVGGPEGNRTTELNFDRGAETVNHMGDTEMRTKLRQDGAKLLE